MKLKHFSKFVDMTDALSAATAAVEGKMSKGLKKVLKKVFASDVQEQLAVADAKLGSVIKVCWCGVGVALSDQRDNMDDRKNSTLGVCTTLLYPSSSEAFGLRCAISSPVSVVIHVMSVGYCT